jgi:hypothetical protein
LVECYFTPTSTRSIWTFFYAGRALKEGGVLLGFEAGLELGLLDLDLLRPGLGGLLVGSDLHIALFPLKDVPDPRNGPHPGAGPTPPPSMASR